MKLSSIVMLCAALAIVNADVYMHHPRGQNDRCDEKSNDRNNNKRLWDSENNSAGGYATPEQRKMVFYEGSILPISYYSQHACGNGAMADTPSNQKAVDCQHVIQLGCEDNFKKFAWNDAWTYTFTDGMSLGRPGADEFNTYDSDEDFYNTFGSTCTNTAPTPEECENFDASNCAADCNTDLSNGGNRGTFNSGTCECCPRKQKTYGYHEPPEWWLSCESRERNKGLFAADENVNNNGGATKTRQEPNSARYGFECTEERDYFPYWHPTPWIDLAVQLSDPSTCSDRVTSLSQNTVAKCFCVPDVEAPTWDQKVAAMKFNSQQSCQTQGDEDDNLSFATKWDCDSFDMTEDSIGSPACLLADDQMDNRLGSTTARGDADAANLGDSLATYNWEIPYGFVKDNEDGTPNECRSCVLRLRYNISTAETLYDYDDTDNEEVKENPVHTVGDAYDPNAEVDSEALTNPNMPLRMAINTAQFGRTFEDRSYIFDICKKTEQLNGRVVHNVNVRGKRGNIAQVRNCLEYDFHPTTVEAGVGDYIVFQWSMSDYNNNGNAGEGRQGTDRTNIVPLLQDSTSDNAYDTNLPKPLNQTQDLIFDWEDLAELAWIGQSKDDCYSSQDMLGSKKNSGNDPKSCHFLNGARAPENANGARLPTAHFMKVVEVKKTGTFNYMCSRNNNFTNRSQKATIVSGQSTLTAGAITGIAIAGVVGVVAIAGIGFVGFQKFGGTSRV